MTPQTSQYLKALLNWADEVEEKINQTSMLMDYENWMKQFHMWKKEIIGMIETKEFIPDEEVKAIKEKGEKMIESLLQYHNKSNTTNEEYDNRTEAGNHKLPPLPYAYNALEPYIAEEIMRLHHDEHHKSYVEGLNRAEKMIEKWSKSQNEHMLKHWMREQSFNGSGHFLHTIFWENMSPKGGGEPEGKLLQQIKKDFGSYTKFKKLFTSAAKSVEGPGWALLLWEIPSRKLVIQMTEKHNMYALWNTVPLLVLDVWEHAYYLQYKTDKGQYIDNWWNVVNWKDVASRYSRV
ncbi:superoxide dismutase [Salirhabdus salicampi]|uniref:superoxide dismutase n=1 Tax=Salirhabdus salicampi TaxID=476102 RepID=UPI0020C3D6E3|nr:superoxide dismutase [Salirhabdus salicampi]MCP8616743.1 superoxide dismutase [Salirhabdus salicampi]